MAEVANHFGWIDWGVVAIYLLGTTWIGHFFAGKQATIRDFFLGGRKLPWQAVCGSIIATEISALTFIGVPGMVFAAGGNFTYLQWAIGSIAARCVVGLWFVKVFYQREIYSPYDYMESRHGAGIKQLTTALFFLGCILGQSVRLLVTAIILQVVSGLNFQLCIVLIGIFAIAWTLMGGMTTVIWTDVVQFFIFIFGGILALLWIGSTLDGGWEQFYRVGNESDKFRILDLTTDPAVGFTLWVGLIAMPFQNMAAFGTDQLNAQRMFCCRSSSDAAKAIIFSSFSQIVTIIMLFVGVGLFAYYKQTPPSPALAELFSNECDYVFPVWITTVLPVGISGLVLSGAFAAAISSLDGALTALSQTTLSLFHRHDHHDHQKLVRFSKIAVVCWGIALSVFAILLNQMRGNINMINLAFGMVSYTYGPMLGIFLFSLFFKNCKLTGVWIGLILSIALALYVRPDLYTVLKNFSLITSRQAEIWQPTLHYAWLYPITCLLTFAFGYLFRRKARSVHDK
ncbi:MAG: sodium:solute symporter family transporter [Verrucomicrobiota bacterium]